MTSDKMIVEINAEHVFAPTAGKPSLSVNIIGRKGPGRAALADTAYTSFDASCSRLEEKIRRGEMEPRDWKFRYVSCGVELSGSLEPARNTAIFITYGPTAYGEWKEDYRRSPEDAKKLQAKGKEEHNDIGFYFSRAMGVTVLPRTSDGKIVAGIRGNDSYTGQIHGAAGWMKFGQKYLDFNPEADACRELEEELGVKAEDCSHLSLVGAVSHPHTLEVDLIYLAQLNGNKLTDYFVSGDWKKAVDAREHKELILFSQPQEIYELVIDGKMPDGERKCEVLPQTAYGLTVLATRWADL